MLLWAIFFQVTQSYQRKAKYRRTQGLLHSCTGEPKWAWGSAFSSLSDYSFPQLLLHSTTSQHQEEKAAVGPTCPLCRLCKAVLEPRHLASSQMLSPVWGHGSQQPWAASLTRQTSSQSSLRLVFILYWKLTNCFYFGCPPKKWRK